ncbi:LysR family transcriptional regulator [Microvirga lotononidis]|uniref:Transcriptional regulator n=1 Tax=Microvirga lotononidis TaxID=864069 RepID=I4YSQ2_9HYPH|nr:LysR family transcriptional regulator [Microvirga lotononidis]EIM26994.1 transcriptional regulator [Microvirga lotononidis]WQO28813.1 LysR family transcriptional regulator [Microvirga lotononidis]
MHTRLLNYFDAIVRHGSIRKAAEAVNVAPSAINRHLLELEGLVGAPLFDRLPRGLRLTAAGEILSLHIRTTLRDYGRAISEIEQLKTGTRGQVTITCIESALADILPDAVRAFADRFPRIEIRIIGSPADEAVRLVSEGQADVCMIFNPPPRLPLIQVAATEFPLGIVAAPDHPLASLKSATLTDLVGHQLILPDESITIHQQINNVLASSALRLKPRIVCNSITFMSSYVEAGGAVTVMTPVGIANKLKSGQLVFKPLRDRGIPAQRLIAGVPDASLPIAAANFCQHLRTFLPTWHITAGGEAA